MQDSIFTKIIKGEIPCHKVYEDEHTFAIMDIKPVQEGMVVVFPKNEIENFQDLPEDTLTRLMTTVQKIMKAQKKALPHKERVGLIVEGFEVPHVHVKLIPINRGNQGAELRAHPTDEEPDHEKLELLAQKIREAL